MLNPGHIISRGAARAADKVALVTAERTLTYGELDALSDRVASGLLASGVRPREVVSIYSTNRWEWVVSYYAVLKAGCIVNTLNAMLTPPEVEYIANDCRAVAMIGAADRLTPIIERRGSIPALRELIAFDHPPAGASAWSELVERPADPLPALDIKPRDLCAIGYTSGTTGHPKGAMQSYEAVSLNCGLTATMHLRNDRDVLVSALPAPHVYGTIVINSTLVAGGTVVLLERFDAGEVLATIAERRATMFEGVPTMYAALLAHPDLPSTDLSSLTRCTSAGQTIPLDTLLEWQERSGAPLFELWGMTEVSGAVTTPAFHAGHVPGSVGVCYPATELRVVSLEDDAKLAPAGEPGELQIRGPLVMEGYLNQPEATAKAITPEGWYRTGDVGYIDRSGNVFVVDRLGDMIITAGYNIYPAELERVIAAHPAVSMVGVGPRPDPVKGELAVAYVVLRPGASCTEDDLLAHCREQLAAYKVPRAVRFVDDLPKTSSGKIMRRQLAKLDGEPASGRAA